MDSLYLDYNATAPLHPIAREAMLPLLDSGPLNPSSIHAYGRRARQLLEEARKTLADSLGAPADGPEGFRVIFTASGTEANNLALGGLPGVTLIVAATEHPSVLRTAASLAAPFHVAPVDRHGLVNYEALEALLAGAKGRALVSVMLANNETGVIQPIRDIADLAHRHGAFLHTDAAQAVGRMPVDTDALGADMLTLSSHKLGGPVGAAALIVRKTLPLRPHITGGGQEQGFRAGTEAVPLIAGFAAMVQHAAHHPNLYHNTARLRDRLEARLLQACPDLVIHGNEAPRLPNTSLLSMRGVSSETQLIHFDRHGIAVSSGSACSSGKVAASHVLDAMQAPGDLAASAIRVSLGPDHPDTDITRFAECWLSLRSRTGQAA